MAQPRRRGAQGATGPVGPTASPSAGSSGVPAGSTPIGIGGSGAYIPKPKPVRPLTPTAADAASAATGSSAADSGTLPADLNASWRGVMDALGVGLPTGLNRAVAVTRRLHRAVS